LIADREERAGFDPSCRASVQPGVVKQLGPCRIYRCIVGSGQAFCLGQQGSSLITCGRLQ
jgi:hypothetical protein